VSLDKVIEFSHGGSMFVLMCFLVFSATASASE